VRRMERERVRAPGEDAAAGAPPRPAWTEWLADRLNPILVREVQQSFHGRAFVVTLAVALTAVVLTAMAAAGGGPGAAIGRSAFRATLVAMTPILLFVVPFGAFLSTRHEVGGGTSEHLLLTRLSPARIVLGKVLAGLVQFTVYLSLFAPLAALTFLLRGVDLPTILIVLGLALLLSVFATCLAVALGASSAFGQMKSLPFGLAALGLGGLTLLVVFAIPAGLALLSTALRSGDLDTLLVGVVWPVAACAVLAAMVAASFLAHPFENRSTGFRVFALVLLGGTALWARHLAGDTAGGFVGPLFTAAAAPLTFFFWMFAASEEENLSPRVRTLVPKRPLLAVAATPFLPGGGRGVLFTLLLAGTAAALGSGVVAAGGRPAEPRIVRVAFLAWAYALFFAGAARLLRSILPAGPRGTWLCRGLVPAALGTGCLLPIVVDVLVHGRVGAWDSGHLFNPFWTADRVAHLREAPIGILATVGLLAGVVLLLNARALARGVREVLWAARTRTERKAR